jgi:hypothetical protein
MKGTMKAHSSPVTTTRDPGYACKSVSYLWTAGFDKDTVQRQRNQLRNAAKRTCLKQERDKEALLENVAKKST